MRLGFRKNIRDSGLAIVDAENNMDAEWDLGKDVGDNRSIVMDDGLTIKNDQLATGDDGLAVDNNRSGAKIDKRIDVNDRSNAQASNPANAGPSNGPDADLIIDNAG